MRIAVFHELHPGGARRVTNEFSRRLKKKHTVDLFYIDVKDNRAEHSCYSSIHYYRFTPKEWRGGDWKTKLYKDTLELLKLYSFHKKVSRDINKAKYDLVIIHPSKLTQAPFILRFLKTRKVYYAHEIYRIMYEPVFKFRKSEYPMKYIYETVTKFIKKVIDKSNTNFADAIFTNSKHTKIGFKKFYDKAATVCYPGVDYTFFKPGNVKKDIDILFIGSLDYETDEYTLFKNSLNFVKRQLTVKVLGGGDNWVSDKELLKFYRRAKLVLCTARFEPLGLVPLESGASGTPALAVNESGYKETIIHNKTGLLVKRNPLSIASVLDTLVDNDVLLSRLGKNAREHVQTHWGWQQKTDMLEEELLRFIKHD